MVLFKCGNFYLTWDICTVEKWKKCFKFVIRKFDDVLLDFDIYSNSNNENNNNSIKPYIIENWMINYLIHKNEPIYIVPNTYTTVEQIFEQILSVIVEYHHIIVDKFYKKNLSKRCTIHENKDSFPYSNLSNIKSNNTIDTDMEIELQIILKNFKQYTINLPYIKSEMVSNISFLSICNIIKIFIISLINYTTLWNDWEQVSTINAANIGTNNSTVNNGNNNAVNNDTTNNKNKNSCICCFWKSCETISCEKYIKGNQNYNTITTWNLRKNSFICFEILSKNFSYNILDSTNIPIYLRIKIILLCIQMLLPLLMHIAYIHTNIVCNENIITPSNIIYLRPTYAFIDLNKNISIPIINTDITLCKIIDILQNNFNSSIYIASGTHFGCDFAIYTKEPNISHSKYLVQYIPCSNSKTIKQPQHTIDGKFLLSFSRISNQVSKIPLLLGFDANGISQILSLKWISEYSYSRSITSL